MFEDLLKLKVPSFSVCKAIEVNLYISALLMRLDHLGDFFEFQGRELIFEMSSSLKSVLHLLPEHVLRLSWLLELKVGGSPGCVGPSGGEKPLSPRQAATTVPSEGYGCAVAADGDVIHFPLVGVTKEVSMLGLL